jgi:hypothetical protein
MRALKNMPNSPIFYNQQPTLNSHNKAEDSNVCYFPQYLQVYMRKQLNMLLRSVIEHAATVGNLLKQFFKNYK